MSVTLSNPSLRLSFLFLVALAAMVFLLVHFAKDPAQPPLQDGVSNPEPEWNERLELNPQRVERSLKSEAPVPDPGPPVTDLIAPPAQRQSPAPKSAVRIRVKEPTGEVVADAPVGLLMTSSEGLGFGKIRQFVIETTTNAEGLAVIPITRDLRQDADLSYAVALGGFFLDRPEYSLDLDALPNDEVVLIAPLRGSIEFIVETSDGGKIADGWYVNLSCRIVSDYFKRAPIALDRARIDWVGLGLQFKAYTSGPENRHYQRADIELDGPVTPGELKSIILPLEADGEMPVLRGRFVDIRGSALAQLDFGWQLKGKSLTKRSGYMKARISGKSDDLGEFEFKYRFAELAADEPHRIEFYGYVEGELRYMTETWIDVLPLGGVVELGDVSCQELPLLVSCRVVDKDDLPIDNAAVHIFGRNAEGKKVSPRGIVRLSTSFSRTDKLGRFTFRSDHQEGDYELNVSKQGYASEVVPFQGGDSNILIVLGRPGALKGKLVCDQNVPLSHARICATDKRHGGAQCGSMKNDGQFEFDLRPGSYSLSFSWGWQEMGGTFAQGPDFEIKADQSLDLGRIEVTIPGQFVTLRLRTEDPLQTQALNCRIMEPVTEKLLSELTVCSLNNKQIVYVPQVPALLQAEPLGFLPLREVIRRHEHDFWLDPGPVVQLSWKGFKGREKEDEQMSLAVFERSPEGIIGSVRTATVVLDSSGSKCVHLSKPGTFEVRVLAGLKSHGFVTNETTIPTEPLLFNLAPSVEDANFEIDLGDLDIERAFRQLHGQ